MIDDDPDAMLRRAASLFRARDYRSAVPAYRRLLAIRPDLPNSWFNLALAERRTREFDAALASLNRALAVEIEGPEEVYLHRALILSEDLGQPAEARAALERALSLNPDYLPAWLNLGNLHEDLGDRDAARDAYARAHAIDSNDALALARLIGVSPLDSALSAKAEAGMSDPRASPGDRADLGFALGAALDRAGAYDAAFAAYRRANDAARAMLAQQGVRYRPDAVEAYVDRAIGSFPWPAATAPATGKEADTPVFICGMFRSGSTLAEAILARHSRVVAGGERNTLPALVSRLGAAYPTPPATSATIGELAAAYRAETERLHPPGTLLTDKRPDNALHVGLIKAMFPGARIVHTVRDPRDTCLSVYCLHAGAAIPYATDFAEIRHYHDQQARLMAHWKQLWPDDIFTLDYDALVADPRPSIESLLGFCGLEWEDAVLQPHLGGGAVQTASVWQVRQPLYRGSSGRWRNYAPYLGKLLDAA